MTDVTEWLRSPSIHSRVYLEALCIEAADEIDKLRAALREIIRLDDDWVPATQDDYTYGAYIACADIARAVLGGEND